MIFPSIVALCLYCVLVLKVTALNATINSSDRYVWDSNLPPRLQWLGNDGYCGEVSLIMAGLKYGQYYSQYDAREISVVTGSQFQYYLVGFNDQQASEKLRLSYIEFPSAYDLSAKDYLAWVKKMTRQGYAVTITVFMNYYLFYGTNNPSAGEADYDHIVSVSRVESKYDDDLYHADDIIVMEDHGLWAPHTTGPVYLFNYTFNDFTGTRQEANTKVGGRVYTLPDAKGVLNFGIAHTSAEDTDRVLLPVRVESSVNFEDPSIGIHSETRPDAMELDLTITVSGLTVGEQYIMYRYENEMDVPASNFNAPENVAKATKTWEFTAPGMNLDFMIQESIMSNQKRIYRAVKTSAPYN